MTSYVSPFTGDVIQPTDVSYRSFTISADTTLSWPINGNQSGNYAARIMEVSASTTGLKLYMPPANQTSVGSDALIRNTGANTFTVVSSTGSTIVSIDASKAQYIYITNNGTEAGTWGIIAFGTGTSSADSSTLAGLGLVAIGSTLNQSHPVVGLVSNYTFLSTDRAQTYIWAGGAGNTYLPGASSLGNNWFVFVKNNGTGTMNLNTSGLETIDGNSYLSFNPDESAIIVCTGTEYISIGYSQSSTFVFSSLVKPVTTGAYSLTNAEASNTIQEYVGTLTGNVTVTYPPVVNLYVVSNQTTAGGYTLTLTTGVSGGTTAVVPAGQQATLICDGVNMLNANTVQAGGTSIQLVNGTVSSPSLSFGSELTTGVYRPGVGRFGISILGTEILDVAASGIVVTGSGTFSGGVAGGTF